MNYYHYSLQSLQTYPVCVLSSEINPTMVNQEYLSPSGIDKDDVYIVKLQHSATTKKTPIAEMREFINTELAPLFSQKKIQYVLCTDPDYFATLVPKAKASTHIGYVCESPFGVKVIYLPSWKAIFYDPLKVREKIQTAMSALVASANGTYADPGTGVLHSVKYPKTIEEISEALDGLLAMNCPLTIDIETFSLKHFDAGIGTITFCWNQHEGLAFPVDYLPIEGADCTPYGKQVRNEPVRELLKSFFSKFNQTAIYHNAAFDIYILVYQLFMEHILDNAGLLRGLEVMLKNWDCTQLITYLATNSCAGNKLSLKEQAREFAGAYSMGDDIKDITKIPLDKLLHYNVIDGLATWFTMGKNFPIMVADQQLEVYEQHFKLYTKDVIQMQLTGMPVNMSRAIEVSKKITSTAEELQERIANHPAVQNFMHNLAIKWAQDRNGQLKTKQVSHLDCPLKFNLDSPKHMQGLLFDFLKFPVLSQTKTKQPSTDADALNALISHAKTPDIAQLLRDILECKLHGTILATFMPAILAAQQGNDGWHYLFGSYKLGGTVSGRLSSSSPNLQNLPSKGKLGKLIKSCFGADPEGEWVFVGLDFASLEDRISALTTKDTNKLKVYTGVTVYAMNVDGVFTLFRDDDTIHHFGKTYTGTEFYTEFI